MSPPRSTTRHVVRDLDGCTFPGGGSPGNGAASAQVMWGHVWTTE